MSYYRRSRGTAGSNGNTILNGSGTPDPALGVEGDYYIDNTNHLIYGPKTGGAWGSGTSLVPLGNDANSILGLQVFS